MFSQSVVVQGEALDVQFGKISTNPAIRQRSVRGLSEGRSNIPHIVVDSGATTDGGLSVSKEVIGQPHARAEVVQRVVLDDGTKCKWVGEVVYDPGLPPVQLVRGVHEFVAQAQVYGQPLRHPPVILGIEAIGIEDEIPVFRGKGGRKLDYGWYVLQEIRELIVLELPVKGVGGLTCLIVTVEQYAKLEGMFPASPIHVVAQSVDVLFVERRRGGVGGTELGIAVASAPVHVDYAGGKTRHDAGTQTIVRQADVSQVDAELVRLKENRTALNTVGEKM